jgi:hypothetical protein
VRRTGGDRRLHDLAEQKANDLDEQANAFRNLSTSLARDDAQNLHPRAGSEIASAGMNAGRPRLPEQRRLRYLVAGPME